MNQKLQQLLDSIQQSAQLSDDEKNALAKKVKEVDKEIEITTFKLDRTEKVKRTTAILLEETIEELEQKRKAVEAQNRELEIESSLERVRTVALSMNRRDDMLLVCHIISDQLELLGVKEIRNVQTAIFYETKGTYSNYEFYRLHDKSLVTEVEYSNHPMSKAFAEQMLKGPEEFFSRSLSGKELKEWYAFQQTTNQFHDTHLAIASSLNYYWYSMGAVALGISTYAPLNEEETILFKRFRNVFELAYRRFLDIEKAAAQAYEAQIELALERVRARTMAMQKSEELADTAYLLLEQFKSLGSIPDQITIGILSEEKEEIEFWITIDGQKINRKAVASAQHSAVIRNIYEGWVNKQRISVFDISGDDLKTYLQYRNEISRNSGINVPENYDIDRRVIHVAYFSKGLLTFSSVEKQQDQILDLLLRFANVFDSTYTRFLDLQKAEAQAREAQIELGLERVRARAMAMQKSEELKELIGTVFTELTKLDLVLTRCLIMIYDPKNNGSTWWMANSEAPTEPIGLFVKNHQLSPYVAYIKAWKERENKWQYILEGKDKEEWDNFLFTETELSQLPDFVIAGMKEPNLVYLNASFNSFGNLTLATLQPLSDEHFDILLRFAKVFDLTYTRFNDLQKAEAQSREAKIETALEKVRSRTMAMQRSDELPETSYILFQQMKELGEPAEQLSIGVVNEENNVIEISATLHGGILNKIYRHSIDEPFVMNKVYRAWKTQQKTLTVELKGDQLNAYNKYRNQLTNSEMFLTDFDDEHRRIVYAAFFSKGMLAFAANEPRPPQSLELLERFASVFDLTYTRFLDLQKAEAQAREAQIETALERVRSKTMAMHNSNDVGATVMTMFDELVNLGVDKTVRCGIGILKDTTELELWTAYHRGKDEDVSLTLGRIDTSLHPLLSGAANAWKNKESTFSYELEDEDLIRYYTVLNESPHYPFHIDLATLPSKLTHYDFYFPDGTVFAFTREPLSAELMQIFKRFAAVFGQTYRRYLDLLRAEAGAREATIEAALEKVRGKAMAMHNSSDVSVTASMVFTELRKLGISPIRCGVGLLHKESRKAQLYSATSSAEGDSLALVGWVELSGHPVLDHIYSAWLNKADYFPELSGEQLQSYYQLLLKGLSVNVPESGQKQYGTFHSFTVGCLYTWSEAPYTEAEIKILKRFANIIDLTFRRYIELQQSETNAKEAVKQAALDRIRADIASMRTISDLDRITPLIWKELTIIGIPFIRCGVFIMDDLEKLIHTFLSTPDGEAIAAFHLPYTTPGNMADVLSHWQHKEIYINHWNEEDFKQFADILVQEGGLASSEQYLKTIPHGGFYLHFLPFQQGMLYAGNTTQLSEDEIKLIQSVAEAFSTAYARYEDFNKLEAAKKQVDSTLNELQVTQKQLIQSEKMASLGELTAGIAHEIQNPLNFVNNFSEVSNELIDEMMEEVAKGNYEEVKAIANDVKQNLEKINHHGKRADGIVKGMLQHSRSSSGTKEPTNINVLADEYLRLAYHGLRAKDKSFNATMKTEFDETIGNINIIPQDIGRVILNLITNAFYAASLPSKGGFSDSDKSYNPTVWVSTKKVGNQVLISVRDNGPGIPQKILEKIFQPFFTTKPTGQGTGLGLSLSYDIVKAHGGVLKVETKEGEGSKFLIELPVR